MNNGEKDGPPRKTNSAHAGPGAFFLKRMMLMAAAAVFVAGVIFNWNAQQRELDMRSKINDFEKSLSDYARLGFDQKECLGFALETPDGAIKIQSPFMPDQHTEFMKVLSRLRDSGNNLCKENRRIAIRRINTVVTEVNQKLVEWDKHRVRLPGEPWSPPLGDSTILESAAVPLYEPLGPNAPWHTRGLALHVYSVSWRAALVALGFDLGFGFVLLLLGGAWAFFLNRIREFSRAVQGR